MAKVAYLLLCHKNADRVLEQARVLTACGDCLSIHIDARAGEAFFDKVKAGTADNPNVVFARRVKCGWGEWSLVEATLNMIDAAFNAFEDATHFFLMSGDCMPIKPAHFIHTQLDRVDQDMVEHADFFKDDWIKTGMKEDRLIYRHWFNERSQKQLFYGALNLQRKLGLNRNIPDGIRMRIGSQWWVLRRSTIEKIREFLRQRSDVSRFFRTTWIPDETFFQTLTLHLVPRQEVVSRPPTLLMFTDYGMPVTFHGDHYNMLRVQDALFARKISDHGDDLRQKLGALFVSDEQIDHTGTSGTRLYDYVRQQGRKGRRYGPRAWERDGQIGPGYEVTLIICKKWHVANRLVETLKTQGYPAYGYVFNQDDLDLPDLGNIQSTSDKRGRHRRAFLKLVFDAQGSNRMAICIDPANLEIVKDLAGDGCTLRLVEIQCDITDAWLTGHAERVGLGSTEDQGDLSSGIMLALRQNIEDEQSDLRALGHSGHIRIRQGDELSKLARPFADGFRISIDAGAALARTPHLFED